MKTKKNKKWFNVSKQEGFEAENYYVCQKSDSIQNIAAVVRDAESKGKRLHAVGSGHSFSDVSVGVDDDYLIDISKLTRVEPVRMDQLNSVWKNKSHLLLEVQGGMIMKNLYKKLEDLGLAVEIMGGCHQQTIAGAISTGTHGTGIELPAVTGMVRSVVIIASEGKTYRIENSEGLSRPDRHNDDEIELIQNDEDFYAVVQGLGCMGIIYSFILELKQTYKLEEVKYLTNLTEVKEKWLKNELFRNQEHIRSYLDGSGRTEKVPIRSLQILINPYVDPSDKEVPDDHMVAIIKQMNVPWDYRGWKSKARNWRSAFLGRIKLLVRIANKRARRNPARFRKMINTALRSLKDLSFIDHAHGVIYQGLDFAKEKAYSSEYAFRIANTDLVEVLEAVIKKLNQEADDNGLFISSPINLRFVKADKFYLSPSFEHDVVYMEIPFLTKTKEGEELLRRIQKVLTDHGGVPHWGKRNDVDSLDKDHIKELLHIFRDLEKGLFEIQQKGYVQ